MSTKRRKILKGLDTLAAGSVMPFSVINVVGAKSAESFKSRRCWRHSTR